MIESCVLHPPVSTYTARSLELVKEIGQEALHERRNSNMAGSTTP
jgi:hypothetical protein